MSHCHSHQKTKLRVCLLVLLHADRSGLNLEALSLIFFKSLHTTCLLTFYLAICCDLSDSCRLDRFYLVDLFRVAYRRVAICRTFQLHVTLNVVSYRDLCRVIGSCRVLKTFLVDLCPSHVPCPYLDLFRRLCDRVSDFCHVYAPRDLCP